MEQIFVIQNTTRDPLTKADRIHHPVRGTVLLLGGGHVRLTRGQSARVTETKLRSMQRELVQLHQQGRVRISNEAGKQVDPTTLAPTTTVVVPAVNSAPNFLLDSAARDKNENVGQLFPQYPGGALPGPREEPSLLRDKADAAAEAAEEATPVSVPPAPVEEEGPATDPEPPPPSLLATKQPEPVPAPVKQKFVPQSRRR